MESVLHLELVVCWGEQKTNLFTSMLTSQASHNVHSGSRYKCHRGEAHNHYGHRTKTDINELSQSV